MGVSTQSTWGQWLGSKGARINNSESTLVKFREGMLPGEKA